MTEPGRYAVNPQSTPEGYFPEDEPAFSVLYGGMGHEAAGGLMLIGLVVFLLAPIVGAWLLSQANDRILNGYWRKVLFFAALGLLFAVFTDLSSYGIANYPLGDALALGLNTIAAWTVVGLVLAWRMKPEQEASES